MAETPRTTPGTPVTLVIGGSDPSGCSGIQADIKTLSVLDVYSCAAITTINASNTQQISSSMALDAKLVAQQIDTISCDIKINACKVGQVGSVANAKAIAKAVRGNNLQPLVVDINQHYAGKCSLDDEATIDAICQHLLPLAAVVTVNAAEAGHLLGQGEAVADQFGATDAARQICAKYKVNACVVMGIKMPGDTENEFNAVDVMVFDQEVIELSAQWRETCNTNGAGTTFAAALTGGIAKGLTPVQAGPIAKNVVSEAVRQNCDLGHGQGPIQHIAYAKVKK